jgi:hypothetical protein
MGLSGVCGPSTKGDKALSLLHSGSSGKFKVPLERRKSVGILKDSDPIVNFPVESFETKDCALTNRMKFLWNALSS